ncbi:hypothetical protein E8E14_011261 [Neopestalotiopsis sp. 37M]|nr:hypothetical protein E8E14_011261 [Neopestalotiopsis sp. 37M]
MVVIVTETDTETVTSTYTTNQFGKRNLLVTPSATPSKTKCSSVYPSTIEPSTSSQTTVASATYSQPAKSRSVALSDLLTQASSVVSEICACIETPQTVTISTTPVETTTVTATSTTEIAESASVTTTPTVTSVSSTTDVVITSDISTITDASTSTTTTTTTSTVTVTEVYSYPTCQPGSSYTDLGAGGCSSNCYCDSSVSGYAVCDTAAACGSNCNSDSDCPGGQFCLSGGYFATCTNGRTCASSEGCTSSFSAKKLMRSAMGMPEMDSQPMERSEAAPVRVGVLAPFP